MNTDTQTEDLPAEPTDEPELEPETDPHPADQILGAADSMAAINALLWEIAKTVSIVTLIIVLTLFVYLAYLAAEWGLTTL